MPGATIASVACCTFPSAGEGIHDAPHRAEQADVRAGRADRGERREAVLEPVDLLQLRDAHRAARAFEQLVRRRAALLALARELAEAELEDARHARRAAARLDAAIELREVAAGPEAVLELVRLAPRAADHHALAEDDRPGGERGEQRACAMTICTGMLASAIEADDREVRSSCQARLLLELRKARQPRRAQRAGIDAGHAHVALRRADPRRCAIDAAARSAPTARAVAARGRR